MPEICEIDGMSIKLIWADHLPKHLHVFIGRSETRIAFDGTILSGYLEPDKYKKLKKWLNKRQDELEDKWNKAMNYQPLERIEP